MTLTNPILLWSLLGMIVPLAIHLLSRKEGKVIRLGSIRHVQETSTQQFKGIKLNEIMLLLLRCLMIAIFSLLLSGLRCTGIGNEKWVLIEPGLENNPSIKTIVDSLKKDGYEEHWLVNNFPREKSDSSSENSYWQLAELLGNKNLDSVIVFTSSKIKNFAGKRIPLAPNIKWLSIPQAETDYYLPTTRLSDDSFFLREGHASSGETYFNSSRTKILPPSILALPPDSIRIVIVTDDTHTYDRRILVTALRVLEKTFPVKMKILESGASGISSIKSDWCFWFSDKNPPGSSTKIVRVHTASSSNILRQIDSGHWEITKRLNEEVAIDENLTLRLAELIIPSELPRKIALDKDNRIMPDSLAWSSTKVIQSAAISSSPADRFLILGLLILLVVERTLAYQRKQ